MESVLVLSGPTAVGKTALALDLAECFGAEIVGADARQIYRGMAVGTAAPTHAELARVAHHLVEFLDPHERYSAARFVEDARAALTDIAARGKRAIVVGGTGFYVRALCGDVALSPAYDPGLRARLAREVRIHPPGVLHEWLRAIAPERAAAIAPGDRYRVLRALEIARTAVEPRAGRASHRIAGPRFVKVFVDAPDDVLAERIERRVDAMLENGLLEEAERIGEGAVAADAVGYPQALAFLRGWSTRPELRELLARATRRYAKRQRTWFRREPDVAWTGVSEAPPFLRQLAREVLGWA